MDKVQRGEFLKSLEVRFAKSMDRHKGIDWNSVLSKLLANPEKLRVLIEMERTGGEPDVIGKDHANDQFIYCDCSLESPSGRRSLCFDKPALDARKENKPKGSAVELASTLGIEVLNEQHYRDLQTLGPFDLKTSSWVATPDEVRKLGGALFCDRRFDRVFVYHNGAESYYAARGFRGRLMI